MGETGRAMSLLTTMQSGYQQFVHLRALLAEYQAGTNTILNATINALYPAAERATLATIIGESNAFLAGLEARYPEVFNRPM